MHPQLLEIQEEIEAARARLAALVERLDPQGWSARPPGGGWSPAECVDHLNRTARAVLPPLREALEEARRLGGGAPRRFRRGVLGWLLWRGSRPEARMKVRTAPAFQPEPLPPDALVAEFERLQEALRACVRAADGLPLQRVRVRSPFDGRVSYNAFAALSIVSVHQHRHLLQAERAAGG